MVRTRNRQASSPSDIRVGRSARRPLTAGSMAFIQLASQAHSAVVSCGLPWRDLPPQYGHWKTVYNRHRRWSGDGTWVRILDQLRRDADVGEGPEWTVAIDAAVVRAHQHAAGARHRPPADIPAEVVATTELRTGGGVESQEFGG